MKNLNLTVPKNMYLFDFLGEEEIRAKIKDSWIFLHDSIIDQLINDGFKRKDGINFLDIFYHYTENISEEIVIVNSVKLPFKKWSVVSAIRDDRKGKGLLEDLYNKNMITVEEPMYQPMYQMMLKTK